MATTKKTTAVQPTHDPEIRPNAVRTQWSARERLRILAAAAACPPGDISLKDPIAAQRAVTGNRDSRHQPLGQSGRDAGL
jgi:hypothetical protein